MHLTNHGNVLLFTWMGACMEELLQSQLTNIPCACEEIYILKFLAENDKIYTCHFYKDPLQVNPHTPIHFLFTKNSLFPMLFVANAIFVYEADLKRRIFSQHCEYWWLGVSAPGHQSPQCWVCTHAFSSIHELRQIFPRGCLLTGTLRISGRTYYDIFLLVLSVLGSEMEQLAGSGN